MYKLIAIDLDGTMLNSYGIVTPKTKEAMIIPASKTVSFKPSNRLKDAMN